MRPVLTLILYYLTLLVFLAAAFLPDHRIWGVNLWAYFPNIVPLALFAAGALVPLAAVHLVKGNDGPPGQETTEGAGSRSFWFSALAIVVLSGLAFYLLRARMHFLGDGYALLANLTADTPQVKVRNLGGSLINGWLYSVLPGAPESRALLSYQISSISAGIAFLITAAVCARRLFVSMADRLLFILGLASGGYMLLFFGYVENYAWFITAVLLYGLLGLLISRGAVPRWVILPALCFCLFFHIFGVALVPSAIYLLLSHTRFSNALAALGRPFKPVIALAVVVTAAVVFYHYYTTSYYLRFSLVPVVADRFTAEGYSLFSPKHLVDYVNLLILLLPALFLMAALLLRSAVRKIFRIREYRFLAVMSFFALGTTFVFDPHLGMPRDWDLFAFCGVPVVLFFYYLLTERDGSIANQRLVAVLAIGIGLLSVLPRAASQVVPEVAIAHFHNYASLDKLKNSNARATLIRYYRNIGDSAKAHDESDRRYRDFPEESIAARGKTLSKERRFDQAIPLFRKAMEVNPIYYHAYSNLGVCFLELRQYDSAVMYLSIADGLNPHGKYVITNLGAALMAVHEYDRARNLLEEAISLDSTLMLAYYFLAQLDRRTGDEDGYYRNLIIAASDPEVEWAVLKELGDYYVRKQKYPQALRVFRAAEQKGLDTTYLQQLRIRYPQLGP